MAEAVQVGRKSRRNPWFPVRTERVKEDLQKCFNNGFQKFTKSFNSFHSIRHCLADGYLLFTDLA